jgi:hypothetical protein
MMLGLLAWAAACASFATVYYFYGSIASGTLHTIRVDELQRIEHVAYASVVAFVPLLLLFAWDATKPEPDMPTRRGSRVIVRALAVVCAVSVLFVAATEQGFVPRTAFVWRYAVLEIALVLALASGVALLPLVVRLKARRLRRFRVRASARRLAPWAYGFGAVAVTGTLLGEASPFLPVHRFGISAQNGIALGYLSSAVASIALLVVAFLAHRALRRCP